MKYPKVLLATPTAKAKDYCLNDWASYVKGLTYPNLDILIIDNSKETDYYKTIQKKGLPVIHIDRQPGEEIRSFMCRCNNIARDKVLNEGYDFMFSLESDIFHAPNVIEHLMSYRKNVVGISYFIQHTYQSRLIPFEKENFGYLSVTQTSPPDRAFLMADGRIRQTYQIGLGCLLIHRSVLEKIKFRFDPNDGELKANADVYFHIDCMNAGIPVFCDWSTFAFHQNGNWRKIYSKFDQGKF